MQATLTDKDFLEFRDFCKNIKNSVYKEMGKKGKVSEKIISAYLEIYKYLGI